MEWYLPGQAPVKDKLIYTRSINDISVTEKTSAQSDRFDKAQFGRLLAKYSEAGRIGGWRCATKQGGCCTQIFEGAADELAQLEVGAEELWGETERGDHQGGVSGKLAGADRDLL